MRRAIYFPPYNEEIVGPRIQKIKTGGIGGCPLRASVIMQFDEEKREWRGKVSPRIQKLVHE